MFNPTAQSPGEAPVPVKGDFVFNLDPRITNPAGFRVAFVIFLDGDLVMSPEHLGVAYMAAVLRRAGFTCKIMEVRDDRDEALQSLVDFRPNLACFSLMSLNIATFQQFSQEFRILLPDVRIACGGPAGTFAGLDVLRNNPFTDIVAIGEGESTIFELVQCLYLDQTLEQCHGICFRAADGKLVKTPLRTMMHNLDDLPFPSRDQLEQHGGKLEYIRISTSRGCVARCSFCSAPHAGNKIQPGKVWRGRSPTSVLDELTHLVDTYQFRTYDFVDSTFEDPDGRHLGKGRIREIASGIIDRKLDIYYNVCMRAENWADEDSDLLNLMFESGLEKVNVGIESGTAEELVLWQKRATVADNERMIRLLREHGIYLAMGFIQFHPYSTLDSLKRNADFLRRNSGHNLRRLTERMEIYPGTPLIKKMEEDGLIDESYRQSLNHYGYSFKDSDVSRLAKHFSSLYNNDDYHQRGVITEQSSVFEFETFNVVLSTFLSRTQRKYRCNPDVMDLINEFRRMLHLKHREMSEFNYEFLMMSIDAVLADKLDEHKQKQDVERVEQYFRSSIDEIKTQQLRLGRALTRAGADLSRINSLIRSPAQQVAKTYIGGGTPCW
jgi:anaerobic magnesium-protoporphyrin IX monomethyl ester cyclase